MSRAIGDIFYPDNPNRRNRFNELLAQIRTYETEFQALEKKKIKVFKEAREKVDDALRRKGYETRDELRQAIRDKISDNKEMKKFDKIKAECVDLPPLDILRYADSILRPRLLETGNVGGVVLDIICLASSSLTVVTGVGMFLGVVAGPAGWALIGVLGAIAAGATIVVAIISFIDAMNERDTLRDGISTLWKKRAAMKYHLDKLDALVQSIKTIVSMADLCDEEELAEVLEENLGRKTLFGPWNTREKLRDQDRRNGSWTNEDPSFYDQDFDFQGPKMTVEWTTTEFGEEQAVTNEMELLKVDHDMGEWVFDSDSWIYQFNKSWDKEKHDHDP
ncbi:hypothetical protein UCRPA7_4955 [Phaeoacremonium minimum UCRPA7]|uniref:Uncharacterized protein n=1 Tax=Phaeoacremonium minimum (strain UCR-PA7) TaxID=1286976 RepID=R8BJX2_PHAM7|nr:hypothetical protein UCRPA7_4955 [Phaeoacremonium minimum UCRPA7]EON99517.1 hypothetical protein UCRPA7_4955 [Phaeoacremonium minimum UCRPA7]